MQESFRLHTEAALKEPYKLTEETKLSNEEESDEEQKEEEEAEEEKNSPRMTFGRQTEIIP
jgi:hypothetical protein